MEEINLDERLRLLGEYRRKMTRLTLRFLEKTPTKYILKKEVIENGKKEWVDYWTSQGEQLEFIFPKYLFSPEVKKHIPNIADAILKAWGIIDEKAYRICDDAQRIAIVVGNLKIDIYNLKVRREKDKISEDDFRRELSEKYGELEEVRDKFDVLSDEIGAINNLKEHIANKVRLEAYGEDTWESLENLLIPFEDMGYLPPEVAVRI